MPTQTQNGSEPLKILVVEDDAATRLMVKRVLEKDGFQVLVACNGEEGLALFYEQAPDLVLTDYSMPGMSGAELTLRIQQALKNRHRQAPVFLPVVVFTGLNEPDILKECLEAGAVEFLTKPFNGSELRTRIHAIAESAIAHAGLIARQAEEQDEIFLLKHLLSRLGEPGRANLPKGFVMENVRTRRINGDIAIHQIGAPGVHFGMICDPMGHGLLAGISEIPTVDVFNTLAMRNLPLPGILAEINRKLVQLLTGDRFSCVTLFRMNLHTGQLDVVNAAMPDALVFRRGGQVDRIPSTSIPLGIQEDLGTPAMTSLQLEPGDCFFACTDGLTDLVSEDEIHALYLAEDESAFSAGLQRLVAERVHDLELTDDITWCLWPFRAEDKAQALPGNAQRELVADLGLNLSLAFHPGSLNYHEIGSDLVGLLGRHGVPEPVSQTLSLLLSETIVNAVDHGALGLDSAFKEAGFEVYELARVSRLAAGCRGPIELEIKVHQGPGGAFSKLTVRVADPGNGFDFQQALARLDDLTHKPYGRGLLLVRNLSRDLAFNADGNEVTFSLYASEA